MVPEKAAAGSAAGGWPAGSFLFLLLFRFFRVSGVRVRQRGQLPSPSLSDTRWLVSRFRSSQTVAAHSYANFGIKRDTSKYMVLVWFLDLKFLCEFAVGL